MFGQACIRRVCFRCRSRFSFHRQEIFRKAGSCLHQKCIQEPASFLHQGAGLFAESVRLHMVKFAVFAAAFHQFLMGSGFDDLSIFDH